MAPGGWEEWEEPREEVAEGRPAWTKVAVEACWKAAIGRSRTCSTGRFEREGGRVRCGFEVVDVVVEGVCSTGPRSSSVRPSGVDFAASEMAVKPPLTQPSVPANPPRSNLASNDVIPPPSTRDDESRSTTMMVVAVDHRDNFVRSGADNPSATRSIPYAGRRRRVDGTQMLREDLRRRWR